MLCWGVWIGEENPGGGQPSGLMCRVLWRLQVSVKSGGGRWDFVAEIERIHTDAEGEVLIDGRWFYRPVRLSSLHLTPNSQHSCSTRFRNTISTASSVLPHVLHRCNLTFATIAVLRVPHMALSRRRLRWEGNRGTAPTR